MKEQEVKPPNYTASELVRIELLRYEQPQGLHPVEKGWRDLALRLLEHVEALDKALANREGTYTFERHKMYNFPGEFKVLSKPQSL